MRLPIAQARAISRGAKTQLRVPVDTRITARPLRPARRHSGRPLNPSAGDILPIDADGRTYCKILAVERGPLGTLTPEQAEAEGYPTVEEFEIDWIECHEHAWLDRQIQFLIEANIPCEEADETRPSWAKVRYDQHWMTREVWTLGIQPFDDMPYLLPNLPDEPEGIPPERIHMRWGIKADRRYQAARHEEERVREAKQLGRRLRSAKLRSPDAPEIAEIEQQLAVLEARYSQAA